MLEKFIELVEMQAKIYTMKCEIEDNKSYRICSLNRIQLMISAQPLFDEFCDKMKLVPKVNIYPRDDGSMSRTQEVFYKNIRILVHEKDYKEDKPNV